MAIRPGELETGTISESLMGKPVTIDSVSSVAATTLHIMTVSDALDALWITAHNNTTATVSVFLVLNPGDDTDAGDVIDATLEFLIPRGGSIPLLEGARFRVGTGAYTIGAYVGSGDASKIWIHGHFVRRIQAEIIV